MLKIKPEQSHEDSRNMFSLFISLLTVTVLFFKQMNVEWKKYGYPSLLKFYKTLKETNPDIKFDEVDEFVKGQKSYKLHKKCRKQIQEHIVPNRENALWFMSNYSRQNKGYKWILLCIDTFV
jgi:alpha-amylase/alpha-mannosidase (GH57 family)